jgi:DNA-binding Xre family transcriptional regulator
MNTVRRVTIDNNQVVILNNNGRIERIPLANLSRMAVEPQE